VVVASFPLLLHMSGQSDVATHMAYCVEFDGACAMHQ
jgi:hypothetical protein